MDWTKVTISLVPVLITLLATGITVWKYVLPRIIKRIESLEEAQKVHRNPEHRPHPVYVTWEARKDMENRMEAVCKENRNHCQSLICNKIDSLKQYQRDNFEVIVKRLEKMDRDRDDTRKEIAETQKQLVKVMTKLADHLDHCSVSTNYKELARELARELKNGG